MTSTEPYYHMTCLGRMPADRKWAYTVKKRFTSFPSPAGMSLTKLPPGRNNSVMT
ncbi:MAG: hypothetical protein ACK55Z_24715 [bacterium]